jgi:thiol-disulfide isomerase/thioredoxin
VRRRETSFRVPTRTVSFVVLFAALTTSGCTRAPSTPTDGNADATAASRSAPSNGFNDEIAWRTLDEGLAEAAQRHRPIMVVVHASWCSSCEALKPSFFDAELVSLSQDLVMVNLDQDVEPRSLEIAPDGDYIPRVVFLDPEARRPDPSIYNRRRANRRYYYSPRDDLHGAMKKAVARHGDT